MSPLGSLPPFTISFGVGDRDDADTFEELLDHVDAGLMQAKATGRDRTIRIETAAEAQAA